MVDFDTQWRGLVERLDRALTTSANDDCSRPMTDKRTRRIERDDAMRDAIAAIRAAPEAIDEAYMQAIRDAARVVRHHHPDASFDDSQGGRTAQYAMLENIARDVEALDARARE